ncbi:MAG: hypothetical protein R2939_12920 [Kofleriaceae bacterium]
MIAPRRAPGPGPCCWDWSNACGAPPAPPSCRRRCQRRRLAAGAQRTAGRRAGCAAAPIATPWDAAAARLLAAFDADGSGELEAGAELDGIDCRSCGSSRPAASPSTTTALGVGFAPGYGWVGDRFGFAASARAPIFARGMSCGLDD